MKEKAKIQAQKDKVAADKQAKEDVSGQTQFNILVTVV